MKGSAEKRSNGLTNGLPILLQVTSKLQSLESGHDSRCLRCYWQGIHYHWFLQTNQRFSVAWIPSRPETTSKQTSNNIRAAWGYSSLEILDIFWAHFQNSSELFHSCGVQKETGGAASLSLGGAALGRAYSKKFSEEIWAQLHIQL